jgi:hypothetical protein
LARYSSDTVLWRYNSELVHKFDADGGCKLLARAEIRSARSVDIPGLNSEPVNNMV